MKEKILAALSAINGQYNFPKEVLDKIATTAPTFESEDKIAPWIDSQKPLFAIMQSYSDNRVTGQQKELSALREELENLKKASVVAAGSNQDDLEKKLGVMIDARVSGLQSKMDELLAAKQDLEKKVSASEEQTKSREFSELKKRVAGDLGLTDDLLSLVDGKLSVGMTEKEISDVLSECKKKFVELGLRSVETQGTPSSSQEAVNNRADAYLKSLGGSQN